MLEAREMHIPEASKISCMALWAEPLEKRTLTMWRPTGFRTGPTWHRVIFKIAALMPARKFQAEVCWMLTLSSDKGGHCKRPVRAGYIE